MAITPVSSLPLSPYPTTLPIPEPGTKAASATPNTVQTDPLPGMLETAYRAPLASSLFPLAGLRGEAPSGEPVPLYVERTYAIAAMGEQASRQGFNPNTPAPRPNPVEAIAAYRAQVVPGLAQGPAPIPQTGARPALDVRA